MSAQIKKVLLIVLLLSIAATISANNSYKIFTILSSDAAPYKQAYNGFFSVIDTYKNVSIVSRTLVDSESKALIKEITDFKCGYILAVGAKAFQFAKDNFSSQQIIFCVVFSDVKLSDEKIMGIELNISEKYIISEIRKILLDYNNLGVIYSSGSEKQIKNITTACKELDLNLFEEKIDKSEDFLKALNKMKYKIDMFMMIADPKVYYQGSIKFLFGESMDNKFPVVGLSSFYTKAGAFISFDYNYYNVGVDTAKLVANKFFDTNNSDRIASGNKTIVYSINEAVAQKLDIVITKDVMDNASEVFGR